MPARSGACQDAHTASPPSRRAGAGASRIALFAAALAMAMLTGQAGLRAQPVVPVTDQELCDVGFEFESGAKADADAVAHTLRAEAEGAAAAVTARAAYGVAFVPEVSFPARLSIDTPYLGSLQDLAAPKSHYRIEMVLIDDDAGAEIASTTIAFDDKPPPFGPPTVVNNPFGGGVLDVDLVGGTQFRLMIELEAHSNGPASNSDFFDGGGGVATGCLRIEPNLADMDGDAIFDDWETSGIDVDGSGIDLDTTALGVDFRGVPIVLDPMRKDVLVEVDYFDCTVTGADCASGDNHRHRPMQDALDQVVDAFAAAPVDNPDGSQGINLWIVVDQALPHQQFCDLDAACFDVVKNANLGPVASQGMPAEFAARQMVFHYNLWGHQKAMGNGSSGEADGGCDGGPVAKWGDDFVVTLGTFNAQVGTLANQRGAFMHELGHNLGLCHGGQDDLNCKPNYQSVMSYTFWAIGLNAGGDIDYSRQALPDLDETGLDETVGIQNGMLWTWFGPPQDVDGDGATDWLQGSGSGPVNWNWDALPGGMPDFDSSASADVNDLAISGCQPSAGDTQLAGADDWANVVYDFRNSEFYPSGHAPGADQELDGDDVRRILEATYWQRRNPRFDYAAKLVCGIQGNGEVLRLTRGAYGTTVNILNRGRAEAEIEKRLVLAFPPAEQQPGNTYRIAVDQLPAGRAIKLDCDDIRQRLFPDGFPDGYVDGFVTIESDERLEVVGVYTASSLNAAGDVTGGASIHIERAEGAPHPNPDLVVEKSSVVHEFPLGGADFLAQFRLFGVLYTIELANEGDAAASLVEVADSVALEIAGAAAGAMLVPEMPFEVPEGAVLGPIVNVPFPPQASFAVSIPQIEAGQTTQIRFWTLALVYLSDPDATVRLVNAVEASAQTQEPNEDNNTAETIDALVD